eukprot:scaffold11234_cov18-Tisochrysis_lutea.AAC.4
MLRVIVVITSVLALGTIAVALFVKDPAMSANAIGYLAVGILLCYYSDCENLGGDAAADAADAGAAVVDDKGDSGGGCRYLPLGHLHATACALCTQA